MTTVSLYPNYALKTPIKRTLSFLFFLGLSTTTAPAVDIETILKDMPNGVKQYINTLPKIEREEEPSKAIVNFLKIMNGGGKALLGQEILASRIQTMMETKDSLPMVIVGYPFKSTNKERKVLSDKVDMGEFVGFLTLNHMCQQIKTVYASGAHIQIYSDGKAYQNLMGLTDQIFDTYQNSLRSLVSLFEGYIEIKDVPKLDLTHQSTAPVDPETLKDITHFMEDELKCTLWKDRMMAQSKIDLPQIASNLLVPHLKKKAEQALKTRANTLLKTKRDDLALNAAQLSYLYGTEVKNDRGKKSYIRLSIHPHTDMSEKCTIPVVRGSRGTPWHLTPVVTDRTVTLKKRSELGNITTDVYTVNGIELAYVKG